ncbi:MAG: dihydroorotate dehydrogenase electron transfer subunit [Gammaproteobacteria bacterium]|nr:dihydroorotate dehydrogenase electron transfer subunit [Gammaproteobacteria bacterium]MDH3767177.1 dihydroorotate dehydrogenase electron transfer subunit [Gammaproteobacteria bacterium]
MSSSLSHRDTIFVEDGVVLEQRAYPSNQFVLRLHAPKCASKAEPGSFAHLTCDPAVPMRRPLSIMRASAEEGWVEFLYKIVGDGLRHLSERREGDTLSMMGPIGQPFRANKHKRSTVLIGGGVGIPPMVFLAEWLKNDSHPWQPIVFMGSEIPFPFRSRPSTIMVPGIPDGVIGCMPLLDEWGIPSRLASGSGDPGCYDGFVTDLAHEWMRSLDDKALAEVEIFACGPTPMLRATARLARDMDVPCQVSLEEFMACAVGGCAGCVVEVRTPDGPAMKRVCVDGPVFDATTVF